MVLFAVDRITIFSVIDKNVWQYTVQSTRVPRLFGINYFIVKFTLKNFSLILIIENIPSPVTHINELSNIENDACITLADAFSLVLYAPTDVCVSKFQTTKFHSGLQVYYIYKYILVKVIDYHRY